MKQIHIPVLQEEVLYYLNPKPNQNFIDCTIGEGGHAFEILKNLAPNGKLLGIDQTPELVERLKVESEKLKVKNLIPVCDNFANLSKIVKQKKFYPVHGILFDLGMSSWHLEESGRGFSFLRDEPLDMRYCVVSNHKSQITNYKPRYYRFLRNMSTGRECLIWTNSSNARPVVFRAERGITSGQIKNSKFKIQNDKLKPKINEEITAQEILNNWSVNEIERVLKEYGEERFAKRIAEKIAKARKIKPIETTFQLVETVRQATPEWYHHQKIHPATRTFQALRIAVNDELNNLKKALPQAIDVLQKDCRLVVISFNSLEDRIVKNFFKECAKNKKLKILTKKPIIPSREEVRQNPRSRSAKLRAALKTI